MSFGIESKSDCIAKSTLLMNVILMIMRIDLWLENNFSTVIL